MSKRRRQESEGRRWTRWIWPTHVHGSQTPTWTGPQYNPLTNGDVIKFISFHFILSKTYTLTRVATFSIRWNHKGIKTLKYSQLPILTCKILKLKSHAVMSCLNNMLLPLGHSSNRLPEYMDKIAWPKAIQMHLIVVDSPRLVVETCRSKSPTNTSQKSHSTTMTTQIASVTTKTQR